MAPSNLAVGFAAGAVLHLLLLVLLAGRRVPTRLDRLFFCLFGALFLWHAGNLLDVAWRPFDFQHTASVPLFARFVAFLGLAALAPLLVHVHLEYAQIRLRHQARPWPVFSRYAWLFYLPLVAAPFGAQAAALSRGVPRGPWTTRFIVYFAFALLVSAALNLALGRHARGHLRLFHGTLAVVFVLLAAGCLYIFIVAEGEPGLEVFQYLLMLSSIFPSALAGYWMFRFNFLEARTQQAVALGMAALLALLVYIAVIQRVANWTESARLAPAVVVEALLIMLLVVLVEPVSRRARGWMRRRVASELGRIDDLVEALHEKALAAPPDELLIFAAERIGQFLGFPVRVGGDGRVEPLETRELELREAAALRLLSTRTAEALKRAQLLAERFRLERELAERQKMAALGEMTAFIAHRLKNPLSAINTLVQVIAEQSPAAAPHCDVIRLEIRRLNTAVQDLLRFTQPSEPRAAARAMDAPVAPVAAEALSEAVRIFGAEAEARGVRLECQADPAIRLPMGSERLHDVLTSLLGNALEAAPPGSSVRLACYRDRAAGNGARVVVAVEDEGPGVAAENQEKIFDPFFTLKPGGTGLGLALARRRVLEAGGTIRCVSPARQGRGARFEVSFEG